MKTKNPIIWKRTECYPGECKGLRTKHAWSVPFTTAYGLVSECYYCGKIRKIEVEKS